MKRKGFYAKEVPQVLIVLDNGGRDVLWTGCIVKQIFSLSVIFFARTCLLVNQILVYVMENIQVSVSLYMLFHSKILEFPY